MMMGVKFAIFCLCTPHTERTWNLTKDQGIRKFKGTLNGDRTQDVWVYNSSQASIHQLHPNEYLIP